MPTASVATAAAVNNGVRRSCRSAYRRSISSVSIQRIPIRLSEAECFVCRWTVDGRDGLAVQPQVHPKLRAVMYQMVQEHLAIGHEPRPFEDRLSAERELPRLRPRAVFDTGQRAPDLRRPFVEDAHELRGRLERQR